MQDGSEEHKRHKSCRNCASIIPAESEKCVFCGSYQVPGRVPVYQYAAESRFLRKFFLFPLAVVFAITIFLLEAIYDFTELGLSWITIFSFFFLLFAVFGYISEWIFLLKAKGESKDFRQGFFEWQKKLYQKSAVVSYAGMFLFVCVPLIDWSNPIPFSAAASIIWTFLLLFLIKILFPLF
ncbi:hypothetical protein CH373_00870 [Leptospira perolatii]|uniref:Zinc ribbon domain-containing protein n=1 Tax=Leptospira perolatii TaxID=2023191 RepID=A0A2M9ZRC8_9LEPT|nr:hypothetical protein [Leptospira perolatii]PJZ71104.1 hypothetical protein CH360_00870 [Leptospira perolatii]PJZ74636.1 hypothetical protein CH373_00870 [Leptospira perolatii]